MKSTPQISVVLPTHNELANLKILIPQINRTLKKYSHEIIVVDDISTDGSTEWLKNFNKRIKKSPKLYFYDIGLLCYLLEITEANELATHAKRGNIFEGWILSEILKSKFNQKLYFKNGVN